MCVEQDDPWKVHFILNSKGGVGKSFIAFLLAQYYCQRGAPIVCFDADATTSTFSSFAALNVTRIKLMQGPRIDERRFDLILEKASPTRPMW
jgi:cellulose biosynthesis protein BcsQ